MEDTLETNHSYSVKDIVVLKSFYKYLKPYKVEFFILIFFDIFVNFSWTAESLFFSQVLDSISDFEKGLLTLEQTKFNFFLYSGIDIFLLIFSAIGTYIVSYLLRKIGQKVIYDFRKEMFSYVLLLSQKQLKTLKTGSFVTRITNDTQNLSTFFTDIFPQFLRSILSLFIILTISFVKAGVFAFVFLAFLPIVFVISSFFAKRARIHYLGEKDAISKMNSFLSESFSGIEVIKTYHREDKKLDEFDIRNDDIYTNYIKSQNLFAYFYPTMYLLQMVCILILCSFSIPAVYSNMITVGVFYLMITYSGQFFQPIQQLSQLQNQLQSILSSATRAQFILDMKPEIVTLEDSIDVKEFKGKVEFRHVYFKYEDGQDYVIKDLSFVIYPGKTVAFVGPTGAGKSTIISLISRNYEAQKGEILIDDVEIHHYSLDCLRRNIGLMMQDVFLFSGTIKDNISLQDETLTDEEIYRNTKLVGADRIIEKLPNKYDEFVSQRGSNFSSGERQLISFSRTLCYHPSLMLLDEATANIDTETERIIEESLEKMRNISTMIVVAHRLSTIKNADHIFVIKKGVLIEEGNHQELLKLKGTYYNLYRLQNMERNLNQGENKNENDKAL